MPWYDLYRCAGNAVIARTRGRETAASPLLAPGLVANAAHDQDVRVAEGGELDDAPRDLHCLRDACVAIVGPSRRQPRSSMLLVDISTANACITTSIVQASDGSGPWPTVRGDVSREKNSMMQATRRRPIYPCLSHAENRR